MLPVLLKRSTRELVTSILLVAFIFRALVPAGFMPASDRPFSIEICRDGFPTKLLSHDLDRHSGTQSHFEHCAFGSASGSGPAPHFHPVVAPAQAVAGLAPSFEPLLSGLRLVHVPQPRAPPSLA